MTPLAGPPSIGPSLMTREPQIRLGMEVDHEENQAHARTDSSQTQRSRSTAGGEHATGRSDAITRCFTPDLSAEMDRLKGVRTDDQRRRILALETERRSLLKAHLAGAVPIDLLQEEQNRISTELANAGALMANAEVHWEYLEKNLDRALAFASNLGDAYAMASPQVRRNLNQSMFEEIAIEVDGSIVNAPMQQPFAAFHDEGFRGWIMDGAKTNPSPLPDRGSNEALLVGAEGLEPPTC